MWSSLNPLRTLNGTGRRRSFLKTTRFLRLHCFASLTLTLHRARNSEVDELQVSSTAYSQRSTLSLVPVSTLIGCQTDHFCKDVYSTIGISPSKKLRISSSTCSCQVFPRGISLLNTVATGFNVVSKAGSGMKGRDGWRCDRAISQAVRTSVRES